MKAFLDPALAQAALAVGRNLSAIRILRTIDQTINGTDFIANQAIKGKAPRPIPIDKAIFSIETHYFL